MKGSGSRPGRRLAVLVCLAMVVGVLAACTSGGEKGSGSPTTATGKPVTVSVQPGAPFEVNVGGATLKGTATAVASAGTITVTPVKAKKNPGEIDGAMVVAVPRGVLVDLGTVELTEPLAVRIRPSSVESDQGQLLAHLDDSGRWSLLPTARDGDVLVTATEDFSSILSVTVDVKRLMKPVGDFVARSFAGRSEPATCDSPPPWAEFTGAGSGTVHACVREGKDSAGTVTELEIKSNRGTFLWVQIPSSAPRRYVWVEDQPDWVRATVSKVFGAPQDTAVLLAPGKRMTIGYDRPATSTQLEFNVSLTTGSVLMSVATGIFSFYGLDSTGDLVWLKAAQCLDVVDIDLNEVMLRPHLPRDAGQFVSCVVDEMAMLWRDPRKAVKAAVDAVAPNAPLDQLQKSADGFFKLGKAFLVVQLSGVAAVVLTQLMDSIVQALGADNAGTVTLLLTAPPRAPATTTTAPPAPDDCGGDIEDAMCRFMDALLQEDPSSLSEGERTLYADAKGRGLTGLAWSFDRCDLAGDVSFDCYVRQQAPDPEVMNLHTVTLSAQNVVMGGPGPVVPDPVNPDFRVVAFE